MPNPLGINAGRPTKYDPVKTPKAAKLAAECGWKDEKIADFLKVSLSTLNDWKIKHPKLLEEILKGRNNTPLEIARSLGMRARGINFTETKVEMTPEMQIEIEEPDPKNPGKLIKKILTRPAVEVSRTITKKYLPPDVAAAKYILNNRDPEHWKESTHIDHTTGGDKLTEPGMDLSLLTDEEVATLAALERKAKGL